jgi:flagellar protein FliS
MSLANAYGNYKHMQIKTTDGGALILMLYDGAIVALKSVQKLIDTKPLNREQIAEQIIIAKNIVYELAASLNLEDGGEIAESLLNLYSYFIWRIGKANLEKESTYLDDVLNHLQDLR